MEGAERELLDVCVVVKVHRPVHLRVAVDLLAVEAHGLNAVLVPCRPLIPVLSVVLYNR